MGNASTYARQLVERIEKRALDFSTEGPETVGGCEAIASLLFCLIVENHGEREARRIFAILGTPPSPRRRGRIDNMLLLERYDRMHKPNVQELARKMAEENQRLPKDERRGAGGVDVHALDRHIRRLLRERKRRHARRRPARTAPTHLASKNV